MGRKQTLTAADVKTTVKKNVWQEWVVRLHIKGKHLPQADYFAADYEDAVQTALQMEQAYIGTERRKYE